MKTRGPRGMAATGAQTAAGSERTRAGRGRGGQRWPTGGFSRLLCRQTAGAAERGSGGHGRPQHGSTQNGLLPGEWPRTTPAPEQCRKHFRDWVFRGLGEISAGLRSQLAGSVSRRVWGPWETTNREGRVKGVIKIHLNMQVQFLFLFLSWVVQGEKTAKCETASSRWEEAGGTGRAGGRRQEGGESGRWPGGRVHRLGRPLGATAPH